MADPLRRALAVGAAACVLGGGLAVTLAVVATPGLALTGYVSEAGVPSNAYASTYRSGVFAIAGGLLLLAATLPAAPRRVAARPAALRRAAALLCASAACTVLSGAVTCSDGCPLPPFDRATPADLVHAGASVAAVATWVGAMLAVAASPATARALRGPSVAAAALALPLSAAVGLAMLLAGQSTVVSVLERLLLLTAGLWTVTTAVTIAVCDGVRRGLPGGVAEEHGGDRDGRRRRAGRRAR